MTVADLMEKMADAGAPMAAILIAVRAIEDRDAGDAARRARAAEKKRNERASQRQSHDSPTTVAVPSRDASATVAPDPSPKEISKPLPETQSPIGDSPLPKAKKGRNAEFEVPDWIPPEPWAAFAEMRRRKKKPLDSYTAKQLFGRLRSIADAGWNIEDVIAKATIGNHDGFWMPDGRDSNVRRVNGSAKAKRPMTAEELKRGIRRAEDLDDPDRAAELKAELAALRPADPKVAALVSQATQGLRATDQHRAEGVAK